MINYGYFLLLLFVATVSGSNLINNFEKRSSKEIYDIETDDDKIYQQYLADFGYLKPSFLHDAPASHEENGIENVENSVENAIKKFQESSGLEKTGKFDKETKLKMSLPRCGVIDMKAVRITNEIPWRNKEITYSISNFPSSLTKLEVRKTLRRAFETWGAVIPRKFIEISSADDSSDIKIKFATGFHGDSSPFNQKKHLAHASIIGDLHFNDGEKWKVYKNSEKMNDIEYDLLWVALHEIGHVLGLDHTRVPMSIMAQYYAKSLDRKGYYIEPRLSTADIEDIQEIYGERALGTCSPIQQNKDIAVSDIKSMKGDLEDCCGFCKITPKCKAYSWNDWEGGTCWLKSATGPIIDLFGVSYAVLRPDPHIPIGTPFIGNFSYFGGEGEKACGNYVNPEIQKVAGVSKKFFISNISSQDPICKYCLNIQYKNKSIKVPISEQCVNCAKNQITLSFAAFKALEAPVVGLGVGAEFEFVPC